MLSKKTLDSVAAILKLTPEQVSTAISDPKEVDLTLEEGLQTFTPAELTTRDQAQKEAGKSEHIRAGKEIMIKELKQETGLDFQGKDAKTFIQEFKASVIKEAKLPESAQVQELTTQLNTLRANMANLESAAQAARDQAAAAQLDAKILASLPKERNPAFSDQDYLLLIRNRIKVETVDGKQVFKNEAGEVIRDGKTAQPKDLGAIVTETFQSTAGWIGAGPDKGGRGGGNSNPPAGGGSGGAPTKYTEAAAEWEAQGKSLNSADFSVYVSSLKEKNKDFEMDLPGMGGTTPPPATP